MLSSSPPRAGEGEGYGGEAIGLDKAWNVGKEGWRVHEVRRAVPHEGSAGRCETTYQSVVKQEFTREGNWRTGRPHPDRDIRLMAKEEGDGNAENVFH